MFAKVAAAARRPQHPVAPQLDAGREVVGGVNLYGTTDDAFEGREEASPACWGRGPAAPSPTPT